MSEKVELEYVGKHLGEGFEIDEVRYDSKNAETGAPAIIKVPYDHVNFLTVGSGGAWRKTTRTDAPIDKPAETGNKK